MDKEKGLPFSQSVRVGEVVYLSGQIGNRPGTLELVPGGMEAETRQTMENIKTALAARGLGFDDVFKCTVMLADMSKWADFNKVYTGYFKPGRYPARSSFGANGAGHGRAGGAGVLGLRGRQVMAERSPSGFDLTPPSDEERAALEADLSEEERDVLLRHGTEAPFCGGLLGEKSPGVYGCRLCGLPLFRVGGQVRVRHRLAELLRAVRRRPISRT